jgi:hypothetical protein
MHIKNDPRVVTSLLETYGALRLKLSDQQADYEFIDTAGTVLDSGTVNCSPDEREEIGPIESIPPTGSVPSVLSARTTTRRSSRCCRRERGSNCAVRRSATGSRSAARIRTVTLRGGSSSQMNNVLSTVEGRDVYRLHRWGCKRDDAHGPKRSFTVNDVANPVASYLMAKSGPNPC